MKDIAEHPPELTKQERREKKKLKKMRHMKQHGRGLKKYG